MLYASVALTAVRGDTLTLEFTVTDQDGVVSNITGTTPVFALRSLRGETVIQSPSDATATLTDPTNGLFRVTVPASVTNLLTQELYSYQAILDDISDNRQTVARGSIHFINKDVSP